MLLNNINDIKQNGGDEKVENDDYIGKMGNFGKQIYNLASGKSEMI